MALAKLCWWQVGQKCLLERLLRELKSRFSSFVHPLSRDRSHITSSHHNSPLLLMHGLMSLHFILLTSRATSQCVNGPKCKVLLWFEIVKHLRCMLPMVSHGTVKIQCYNIYQPIIDATPNVTINKAIANIPTRTMPSPPPSPRLLMSDAVTALLYQPTSANLSEFVSSTS